MTFREFMRENGYELQTTFWEDFSIADRFGLSAIQDTFKRAFEEWKNNYKYLTELILVLNHENKREKSIYKNRNRTIVTTHQREKASSIGQTEIATFARG